MAGVFLSYSSQDRERVALLAESLRAEGFEVWWDREIPVAVTYEDYIRQQLDTAGAVVVVWSPESVASRYVRWEVRRAERRCVLVPVVIEEADLPPEYFLVQSADLTRWTGDRSDREWRRLVAALVRLVGQPVRPEVVEEKPAAAALPAEVPAEVVPASELMVPEAAPVVEEAAALEEAAAPPAAITAEPIAAELESIPEEAIPIPDLAEAEAVVTVEPVEGGLAPAGEELGEGAALAEAEVGESLRAWEPVAEEAPSVRESVVREPAPIKQVEAEEAPVLAGDRRRPVPWYRQPLVLAAAGALVLAAVVVPIVVVLSGGGEEATTTLAVSTTEAVSTTDVTVAPTSTVAPTTTVAIPDVPDMEWARLPFSEALVPPAGWGVAGGPGRVAVGADDSGGDLDAAVYVTSDGVTWERIPHDEAVFGGPGDQQMRAVAVGGPGLVAVGRDGSDGAVWTSADGLTWERVAGEGGVFASPREVWGVTAGGPGLVAVGCSGSGNRAMVWTSTDGTTWLATTLNSEGLMTSVTVGGPGLVAVGQDGDYAAVWTSADGAAWERVPDETGVFGRSGDPYTRVMSVAAAGPGLVAAGWQGGSGGSDNEDAAVWASVDGLTWERVAADESIFGGAGAQTILGLAVVEDLGLIAWGEDFSTPEWKGIWVSPPVAGLEWARVAEGSVDVCFGCAVVEDLQVQVRCDYSGGSVHAEVWTRGVGTSGWQAVPDDGGVFGDACMVAVVAGGPGLVAVGFDSSGGDGGDDAVVWVSADGLTWERVPHGETVFGGGGSQEMTAVVAGGPGLVAVGIDRSGDYRAAVWTSVDGLTWERVPHDETVFDGDGQQEMRGVVVGGPGLVAIGVVESGQYTDAAVWTSVDGLTWEQVPHDGAVFGGPGYMEMRAVVAGGPGFVAVGNDEVDGDRDAVVWWSRDGLTWVRVPHDENVFGGPGKQEMDRLAVCEWGLVAGGWGNDESGAFWVSPPPG